MTKARKGIMWSLIAVLAALLVALAVVGVTFARYSSEGEGSGSASVAKWDVAVVDAGSGEGTVMAESFSPSADSFEDNENRHNESEKILVATITNSGNVDATVTVSGGTTLTYTFYDAACSGGCVTSGAYTGSGSDLSNHSTTPGNEGYCDFCYGYDTLGYGSHLDDHFSLKLYQGTTDSSESATSDLGESTTLTANSGTMYIFAEITWTSDIADCTGTAADAFDTWCGHYLASISFDLAYEAVQASAL